ncbi:MAG TPA: hypothetical protein PKA10_10610 [Selenomonadales bacterium]|nr:hypothetical protein [Selenomonadales bacterium]
MACSLCFVARWNGQGAWIIILVVIILLLFVGLDEEDITAIV